MIDGIKKKIGNIKKWISKHFNELLIIISFFILVINTCFINIHAGMYLLSILMLVTVYTSKK